MPSNLARGVNTRRWRSVCRLRALHRSATRGEPPSDNLPADTTARRRAPHSTWTGFVQSVHSPCARKPSSAFPCGDRWGHHQRPDGAQGTLLRMSASGNLHENHHREVNPPRQASGSRDRSASLGSRSPVACWSLTATDCTPAESDLVLRSGVWSYQSGLTFLAVPVACLGSRSGHTFSRGRHARGEQAWSVSRRQHE